MTQLLLQCLSRCQCNVFLCIIVHFLHSTNVQLSPVLLQILLSCYMLVEFVSSRPRQLVCSAVEVTATPASLRLANACWLFHISKMVDLLDTLFLVLKKDFKRITYLHVFHHASMYISVWLITLFTPGKQERSNAAEFRAGCNALAQCILSPKVGYFIYPHSHLLADRTLHFERRFARDVKSEFTLFSIIICVFRGK